jgi:hypothetical protein
LRTAFSAGIRAQRSVLGAAARIDKTRGGCVLGPALRAGERALFVLMLMPAAAASQMTVSGQVTSATGAPVQGASVSIDALNISARTSVDGRYNFIIRQAQVMGQTVAMTARHGRFGSQSVQIRIVGGSLEQNFVLTSGPAERPRTQRGADTAVRTTPGIAEAAPSTGGVLADQSIAESAGPTDLASALAGRHAALRITSATTAGGSASMLWRGVRSFSGNVQPLVVVDGTPVDNQSFTTIAQGFGLGGFDYGSPLNDISLDDIERVELVDPVAASLRYGSRAANGVINVTTKSGRNFTGFAFAVTQRFARQSAVLLPDFQNTFGQGLGGQYEFFDGQGGGINDDVAQSWGPLMDARPIVQHSLTEPRRPEVRHWIPQPDDVRDYFEGATTYDASLALQGSRDASHLRAGFNARSASGLTPGHTARRLGITLGAGARVASKLSATANLQFVTTSAEQRPGTGFHEVNPVSGFARMGRQVDLDALRGVTDENGDQINWIYTGDRNNTFFATTLNANDDERRHIIGGLSLTYEMTPWLAATLSGGTDDWRETRKISVAEGWLGGFPTTLGSGDFAGGGTDDHGVNAVERLLQLSLTASNRAAAGFVWSGLLGGELRSNDFTSTAVVMDDPGGGGESSITSLERTGDHEVTSFFASATTTRGHFALTGGARFEQSSSLPKSYSVVYPSAQVTWDAVQLPAIREALGEAKIFARFWQAGNEITRRTLATTFFPGTPLAPELDVVRPERTTGIELGTRIFSDAGRAGLDLAGYRERSTDVLALVPNEDGSVFVSQSGEIFNGGIEAAVRARVVGTGAVGAKGDGMSWDLGATFARNSSTVDQLAPTSGNAGEFEIPLSPNLFGARPGARVGNAAGIILGSRQLRNDAGRLMLRNGLPVADATAPFAVLGAIHPDWTATLRSDLRFMGAELSLLVDSRMGGKIFSSTNMWGSFSGTLESTLIGDRAPGANAGDSLTIAGVDSATGAANTTKVSAEQYFHAIGAIVEPWVYDASYTKLREARLSYSIPSRFIPAFREHFLRVSLIGRNLFTWADAPNIDPEMTAFAGFEMGQLPSARSVGVQVSIAP